MVSVLHKARAVLNRLLVITVCLLASISTLDAVFESMQSHLHTLVAFLVPSDAVCIH